MSSSPRRFSGALVGVLVGGAFGYVLFSYRMRLGLEVEAFKQSDALATLLGLIGLIIGALLPLMCVISRATLGDALWHSHVHFDLLVVDDSDGFDGYDEYKPA